jgi:hypothetical protein
MAFFWMYYRSQGENQDYFTTSRDGGMEGHSFNEGGQFEEDIEIDP